MFTKLSSASASVLGLTASSVKFLGIVSFLPLGSIVLYSNC